MATIIIDPGHGGTTNLPGSSANNATGASGALEKDLTLAVALRVRDRLTAHAVHMTRDTDENLSASDRAQLAANHEADIFVSIHFNGFRDPAVQGTEVLVRPPVSSGSSALAQSILDSLVATLRHRDRGLKEGQWAVLTDTVHLATTARCIAEVSFLTDPAEDARLADPAYLDRIADAVVAGIEAYLSVYGGARRFGRAADVEIDEQPELSDEQASAEQAERDSGFVRSEELARAHGLAGPLNVRVLEPMTPNVPVDQMARGIDVSYAQSRVAWGPVADSGQSFAICKATEGETGQDAQFLANFSGIRDVGLVRGAYHLLKAPWSSAAQSQVDNYLGQLALGGGLQAGVDLPPFLDIEYAEVLRMYDPYGRRGKNRQARNHVRRSGVPTYTRQQIIDHILDWCDRCERTSGWRPLLYLGPWTIYLLRGGGRQSLGRLTEYDLWLVSYRNLNAPKNPVGWPSPWKFWQYSSRGHVPGIPRHGRRERRVDMNVFNGTLADLRRYAASNGPR